MDQQNTNNQFQRKWVKETANVEKERKYKYKKKKSKSGFFKNIFNRFINQYNSIIKELFHPYKKKESKRNNRKKNIFTSLSNRSIILKAIQNSVKDIKKIIFNIRKSLSLKKREIRKSEVLIQKKIKKKKREENIKRIKSLLLFQFLKQQKPIASKEKLNIQKKLSNRRKASLRSTVSNIFSFNYLSFKKQGSKDSQIIKQKLKKKRIENIKTRLTRLSQLKFTAKRRSISEKMHQRELREKRNKKIKKLINDLKTLPKRSIRFISNTAKSIFDYIINIKSKFYDLKTNIARINSDKELKSRFIFSYTNSTTAFISTFLFVYFANQIITSLLCASYSIPIVLYYFDIIYQVGPYSTLWNRFNILIINGSAPFFSLLLSVLFYRFFKFTKTRFKYLRIYMLWGMIHAFIFFFGAYIVGAITRSGFVYFTEWLFFSYMFDIEEIIFMVCCLIALLSIGYFSSDFFLSTADNKDLISFKNKKYFKYAQIFLPWLTGIIILIIFNIPNITVYNLLIYSSLLLIIIPAMLDYQNYKTQQIVIVKSKQKYSFLKWNIIGSILLIIIIRYLLNDGIWLN